MIIVRSACYALLVGLWTILLGTLALPLLVLRRKRLQQLARFWCRSMIVLAQLCCGLRGRILGLEHLPQGAAIIASKHQSAWETLAFYLILDDPVYVMKRELLQLPFLGWYMRRIGMIAIDRAAGFRAIKTLLPAAMAALADGAQIIIFPEGTRTSPGSRRRYQPGIVALYERAGLPVVPVAVNSGLFWGRKAFLKYPGEITMQILSPIPPGLRRADFLARLEQSIEDESARLAAVTTLQGVPSSDRAKDKTKREH